ncbi:STAS domain-containing protein [Ruminococcus sp.]|uniref:STAS domain-containing protein n=1 Tax=Ruminococcus sp. TaxID=41978 RepID=UPI00388DD58E
MTIQTTRDGGKLYARVQGRIDTNTVGEAEKKLKDGIESVTELVLDFKEMDYISSAGLRLLLSLQKIMNRQGSLKITNVSDAVMEIFEVTGFSDILTIE